MIINTRIDERLIHGQIATMWTNHLNAERIIIVDDAVVHDDMQKQVLKLAKPGSVKLSILTAVGFCNRFNEGAYDDQRVFLIVKNPSTLVDVVKNGVAIEEVNVGNMSDKEGSRQVAKSINVTAEDVAAFEFLNAEGVNLVAQMTPSADKRSFMPLVKEGA